MADPRNTGWSPGIVPGDSTDQISLGDSSPGMLSALGEALAKTESPAPMPLMDADKAVSSSEATGTTGEPQTAVGAPIGAATASSSGAPTGAALVVQVPTSGEEDCDDTLSATRSVSDSSSTRRGKEAALLAAQIAVQEEKLKSAELKLQQAHADMVDRPPSSKHSRSARRPPRGRANMSVADDLLSPSDVLPPPALAQPPHGSASADLGGGALIGAAPQQIGDGISEEQVSRSLDQALTAGLGGDLHGPVSRLTEENLQKHQVGRLVAQTFPSVSYTHLTLPTIYSV